ncbi:MAG: amino acid adenylation domain-containing protein [bacterium]
MSAPPDTGGSRIRDRGRAAGPLPGPGPSVPYDRDASIAQLFEAVAARRAGAIAVEQGPRALTYAELDSAASRVPGLLQECGVAPGDVVGVAIERSPDAIIAFLGVLKAGAAYLPLELDHPPARLALMLRDTQAVAVLALGKGLDRLAAMDLPAPVLDLDAPRPPGEDRAGPRAGPQSVAYVMYTSGSTGVPKGVEVLQRGVVREALGSGFSPLSADDAVLSVNPLVFDGSVHDVYAPLLQGSRLVLTPPGIPSPALLRRLMRDHGVTVLATPTAIFHELVDAGLGGLERLREIFIGGDVLSPEHVRHALGDLPGCHIHNCYGPTETTCDACAHEITDPGMVGERVPIGRPLPNTRAYVLDRDMKPVDPGGQGELYLGGDGLARGYAGHPELTAERFVADPFDASGRERLYRTGDRVRLLPDGTLDFLGRLDDQVKIRGFRIEPGEVEAALRAHGAVSGAAVVARDENGRRRLVAYVVFRERGVKAEELQRHLAARLPRYLLPTELVPVAALPLNANGKVDRAALPAPPPRTPGDGRAPETDGERRLAAIWTDLLDLDGIAAADDFFALGGDSLLVMRLLARIATGEGVELSPEAVFAHPTLAGLAAAIEEGSARSAVLPPITRERRPFAPLSFAQERVWFLQRLEPSSRAYQFQDLLWLEGDLDRAALRRALNRIVRRHEILRTTFPWGDGGPIQVIHPLWRVPLPSMDLTHLPEPEREPALRQLVAERVSESFDIARLPLVRWSLFRLGTRRHALLHVEHHLVHDGWSWAVFRRELAELYAAVATGRDSPLPRLAIQFGDFARWQRAAITGELAEAQLEYWRKRLGSPPPPLDLPADRPRPRRRTFRGERLHADLPDESGERIRALGASVGATPFMVMLTAFYALLRALTAEEDLCVGTGVANRRRPEAEGLLGMVLNTVALRVDAGGDPTGRELLHRVRVAVIEALANQDIPFDWVVEAVGPRRDPGRMPLYDVLFSFDDSPRPPTLAAGLGIVADEGVANLSAKADLNVIVINHREGRGGGVGGLRLLWEYSTDLFEPETAAGMLDGYQGLLEALVADSDRPLSSLADAAGVVEERAAEPLAPNDLPYEREATIAELFEARAGERPDATALESAAGTMSYGELDRTANRLAHRLRALGVGHETLVGAFMERSPELVVAMLGILKAGAAYVPLDPDYPPARLGTMLDDTAATVVLTQPVLAGRLPDGAAGALILEPGLASLAGEPSEPLQGESGPESLAYVMYTSGSTGRPKGVEALQRGVVRLVRGTDYASFGPGETFLALAPATFDASTFEIWGALLNGARLVLAPPSLPTLAELGRIIRRHRVTTLWLAAGLFQEMVETHPEDLRGLRQLLAGGDVLSPIHVRRALEANPGLRVINGYGPTEATTFACCHEITDPAEVTGPVPIGRPIAHTVIRVLDEGLEPVAAGGPGELFIGGDGLARGYHRRPEITAERFVEDPLRPGERLYRTGDSVRSRPDGTLDFLGRMDDQVKIRGFRVEPGEVEVALAEHPEVSAAAVVAQGSGAGDRRLVAFVVPAGEGGESAPLEWLAERLPAHMVPSACARVPALPLTPNGKVDRAALVGRRVAAEAAAGEPEAPRNEAERRLASIWERLLGAGPVGRHDDFFALGGHSLMTLRLFADIEAEFGRELPVAAIFDAPTLAELAARIDTDGAAAAWRSLVPMAPGGGKRPFFCVHGAGGNVAVFAKLSRALDPDRPFYGLQSQGLDGRTRPHERIEDMAAHYLHEIRTVQPRGPYLLGGMCHGAVVALEMSQQLQASGEEVALLAVLDSKAPRRRPAGRRGRRRRASRARTARDRVRRTLRRRLRRARLLVRRARRRGWRERGRAVGRFLHPERRATDRRIRRVNVEAVRSYVARPYAGRVALFESEDRAAHPKRRSRAGWEEVARGGLDYQRVPGGHNSMLGEPHVDAVAAQLAARLDGADGS